MHFKSDQIKSPAIIRHNDIDHFLCSVRQKPIQALPEEILRQKLISYLHHTLHFPLENIGVEVPLSYFKKGQKGRADIIVYDQPLNRNPAPLILIECKAYGVALDFRCEQQLKRYQKVIKPKYGGLTNGKETKIYNYKKDQEIIRLPNLYELITGKEVEVRRAQKKEWVRTKYHQIFKRFIFEKFVRKQIISPHTCKDLTPIIVRLADLFYDTANKLQPIKFDRFSIIEDCGIRFADYGYAFSSGLLGYYRFFLIKHPNGNHQVVSFSIYHQNEWGTYLMVGVDNRKGHSLELKLDKFITGDKNKFEIIHDGSLTVGKRGRIKNREVLDFVESKAGFLIRNGSVFLGELLAKDGLYFHQKNVQDFLYRVCYYAILREDLRREIKESINS
ncbi:Type I restriction enzyme R protein N terminus (HSDR_N) [Salinimicrobium catena]|uniref:Type I restriction enzyme R protein N terminus (HSDR_N) n=1 Tax=Salinimicrobium catena TaxID=390640 RepID=A0A1H5N3Q6_9FLAO|nr:type I restriction enzyme HsdR N-terminal domain-containing protein [Salinimicrobium catena]SDL36117.1 Type I restriction enzyme R protein N terminus (HSDR_N) [Salinimicrobium catena]SEE96214.1 Type I restriction enzyme R protein N terminus (HSDR_N) [Salinimicrobium catena]